MIRVGKEKEKEKEEEPEKTLSMMEAIPRRKRRKKDIKK